MNFRRQQMKMRIRIFMPVTIVLALPIVLQDKWKISFLYELPLGLFTLALIGWMVIVMIPFLVCVHALMTLGDLYEERVAEARKHVG